MHRSRFFLLVVLLLSLTGCAGMSHPQRVQVAADLAGARGWRSLAIPAGQFTLHAFVPSDISPTEVLSVYIEGDGFAWVTPAQPSSDPTPMQPLGLALALAQPRGTAVYLARPCQYVEGEAAANCTVSDWTDRRFGPAVIAASNFAVDRLKRMFAARRIELVGYSGGGAVAALVAARRQDVCRLLTVAGNLDHREWTRLHRVLPLDGSMNPADAWAELLEIPQVHFVGAKDGNMPLAVAASYRSRFPPGRRPSLREVAGADHGRAWVERWPDLYRSADSACPGLASQPR